MLHYQVYRNEGKEWLVFIHGAGGAIATWRYQTEAFKPYFNLLLLDLRDHGLSKNIHPEEETYDFDLVCTDILQVIDHLGIEKAHFISLSLGSAILQRLDQLRPELIAKMVMAGGIFRATLEMKFFVRAAYFLHHFLPYRWMYNIFSWVVLPKKNHQLSRRIYRMQAMKLSPGEYLKWVGLYGEFFKLLDNYFHRKLEKMSLVVMGAEDHVFFQAAKKFVERQEQARLVVFEKCGHICNIEQWQRFNQVTLQFLKA